MSDSTRPSGCDIIDVSEPSEGTPHHPAPIGIWVTTALLAAAFAVVFLLGIVGPRRPVPVAQSIIEGVIAAGGGVLALLSRRRRLPHGLAHPAIAALLLLATANIAYEGSKPDQIDILPLTVYPIVACGAAFLSVGWFAAALAAILSIFLAQFVSVRPAETAPLLAHLMAAASTAIALFAARRETRRRLSALKNRDTKSRRELEQALAQVEEALADQTRLLEGRRVLEEQLGQAQKMEAVGVLAGGIAHGMNNILGTISARASLLKETEEIRHLGTDVDEILVAAKRGGELTRNLLGFARKGQFRRLTIDLHDAIRQTLQLLHSTVPKSVIITARLDAQNTVVEGDAGQISQMLLNLCLNAVDAMPGGGRIAVETADIAIEEPVPPDFVGLRPGNFVQLAVSDNGAGMDDRALAHVFEPFFTTKGPDKGTGLGLAMVYGTVQAHGGRIRVESRLGAGTAFRILIPSVDVDCLRARVCAKSAASSAPRAQARTVLVVDDDPMIRAASRRLLQRLGCRVVLAGNGREALEVYRQREGDIDLVILDVAMPVMDGSECFQALKRQNPHLPIIISSGFADDTQTERLVSEGATGLLPKPYDMNQMADILNNVHPL